MAKRTVRITPDSLRRLYKKWVESSTNEHEVKKAMEQFEEALGSYPPLPTIQQATHLLNISRTSVRRLIDNGDLERIEISLPRDEKVVPV